MFFLYLLCVPAVTGVAFRDVVPAFWRKKCERNLKQNWLLKDGTWREKWVLETMKARMQKMGKNEKYYHLITKEENCCMVGMRCK